METDRQPTTARRRAEVPLRVGAIAVGGALGTLGRYGAEHAWPPRPDGFPWTTLGINFAGSFALALLLTLLVERWPGATLVRPFAAIGLCGGFTTFSTVAVEVVQRGRHGHAGVAAVYLAATLLAGVAATVAGIALARGGFGRLRPDVPMPDPDDMGMLPRRGTS
jgi:CrcB protein